MSSVQLSCSTWPSFPSPRTRVDTFGARRAAIRTKCHIGSGDTFAAQGRGATGHRTCLSAPGPLGGMDLKSLTTSPIRAEQSADAPYATAMLGTQGARAVRTVRSYARWVVKAKPGDYVIVLCVASASVPLVGRHLEVLGGFAALGVGGRRYVSSTVARLR